MPLNKEKIKPVHPVFFPGFVYGYILFNGISTFMDHLMPKAFFLAKISDLALWHINYCRSVNVKSIFIHINSSISNNSV